MQKNTIWQIDLVDNAPPKPPVGNKCNGCGICCASILCPIARVRFLKESGPCAFLKWRKESYFCALIARPFLLLPKTLRRFFYGLPQAFRRFFYHFLKRKIAAYLNISKGCDCTILEFKEWFFKKNARLPWIFANLAIFHGKQKIFFKTIGVTFWRFYFQKKTKRLAWKFGALFFQQISARS